MSRLRSQLIRLAHARADLRPHLLPILKGAEETRTAFVRLPTDALSFAFSGPGAEAKGKMLASEVRSAVEEVRTHSRVVWRELTARIHACSDVDAQPLISRNFVGLAMQDVYSEVSRAAVDYFEAVPKR